MTLQRGLQNNVDLMNKVRRGERGVCYSGGVLTIWVHVLSHGELYVPENRRQGQELMVAVDWRSCEVGPRCDEQCLDAETLIKARVGSNFLPYVLDCNSCKGERQRNVSKAGNVNGSGHTSNRRED